MNKMNLFENDINNTKSIELDKKSQHEIDILVEGLDSEIDTISVMLKSNGSVDFILLDNNIDNYKLSKLAGSIFGISGTFVEKVKGALKNVPFILNDTFPTIFPDKETPFNIYKGYTDTEGHLLEIGSYKICINLCMNSKTYMEVLTVKLYNDNILLGEESIY